MKLWFVVGFIVTFTVPSAMAEPASRCKLAVDGETYISGPCDFEDIGDGDFMIAAGDYFAYVYVTEEPANGFWNGVEKASHAHEPLGDLKRAGACWENATAKVCASK